MFGSSRSQSVRFRMALGALALAVPLMLVFPAGGVAASGGNGAAAITGSFADTCRDFTAHSSKDISHVEIHYSDGRATKDDTTDAPDYALDGSAGEEIEFAIVKSGTTSERFECATQNGAPTAILEVKTPGCFTWPDGLVACDGRTARTTWSHSTVPSLDHGVVQFFCSWPDDQSCVDAVMPCGQLEGYSLCQFTYSFRGTSSTDPDDDIASWSLDFGDGTSVGGNWATSPPSGVSHEFVTHYCPTCDHGEFVTLTVTDSSGQTDSDTQFVHHVFPD